MTRVLALTVLVFASQLFEASAALTATQASSVTNQLIGNSIESTDGDTKAEFTTVSGRPDHRRPIWAIAHMVNSIKELEYRLKTGANGIEADVTFGKDGEPLYTYHGPPCDCWRHCYQQEKLEDYLNFIREVSIDDAHGLGRNLTLLFLDLKLDSLNQRAKENAGSQLAKMIVDSLFQAPSSPDLVARRPPLSLIISVNHVNDIDLVRNFIHTLEINNSSQLLAESIGFDVGMNDDLYQIESMWNRLAGGNGAGLNVWQGDGYTNCLSPFYKLERLSGAVTRRDNSQGYPAKVYHWTIDLHDRIRESLLMGVDAIMTNHPERLLTVLREPLIAHDLRLATRADNPFKKLTRRVAGRSNETARYQRSAYTPSGGLLYSLIDVLASWMNYIREIPLLSYPTTLVSRSPAPLTTRQHAGVAQKSPTGNITRNVTRVVLESEPVYKLLAANTTNSTGDQERNSESSDKTALTPDVQADYEGPKWYTSLVSNVLVSIMKVLMPVG